MARSLPTSITQIVNRRNKEVKEERKVEKKKDEKKKEGGKLFRMDKHALALCLLPFHERFSLFLGVTWQM